MIEAVLFDVDDTLYEPMEPFKGAFAAAFPDAAVPGGFRLPSCTRRAAGMLKCRLKDCKPATLLFWNIIFTGLPRPVPILA